MSPHRTMPSLYKLKDLPEFKRFQAANPGKDLDALQSSLMFGKAIHWLSILEVLWPDFTKMNWYSVEVAYIVCNDPEYKTYPREFYDQIAQAIAFFWRLQLEELFPNGNWKVVIRDDDEITVEAAIEEKL